MQPKSALTTNMSQYQRRTKPFSHISDVPDHTTVSMLEKDTKAKGCRSGAARVVMDYDRHEGLTSEAVPISATARDMECEAGINGSPWNPQATDAKEEAASASDGDAEGDAIEQRTDEKVDDLCGAAWC